MWNCDDFVMLITLLFVLEMIIGEVNVTVVPQDPAPGQAYTVTVDHPGPGTIELELDGTDSYFASTSCTNDAGKITCFMTIPGGSAGVEDIIAVYFIDASGNRQYVASATVVF